MNKKRAGRIIALSGVDCSGKTTQLKKLEEALKRPDVKVVRVWFRPGYSRGLDVARRAVRWLRPEALPTASQWEARRAAFSRRWVATTWVLMALMDMVLHYGLWLRALRLAGYTVLADRGASDGYLDLQLRFPNLRVERWLSWRIAARLFAIPDHALVLNLSYEEMLKRMNLKKEPFPDPPDVRDARFMAYQRMAREEEMVAIDANESVEEVHRQIMQALQ